MNREKKSRKVVRAVFTRIHKKIEELLKQEPANLKSITETYHPLELAAQELSVSDKLIFDFIYDEPDGTVSEELLIEYRENVDEYQEICNSLRQAGNVYESFEYTRSNK